MNLEIIVIRYETRGEDIFLIYFVTLSQSN